MERLGRQLYLTFRTMRERFDDDMRAAGGSMSQWVVLKTLAAEPGLSHKELAERMLLTGSTLTHHLDRMEADGFIVRTRDVNDRRVVRVSLSPEGKHRCTELDAVSDEGNEHLLSLLSEREALTLNRLLAKLQQRLEANEGDRRAP